MTRAWSARAASRLYRLFQRAAARDVRSQYAEDMRTTFDALADETAGRGVAAMTSLLARESFDLIRSRRMHTSSAASSPEPRRAGSLFRDLRQASRLSNSLRALSRRPWFAATAIAALAAGTAATTAIFSLVDTVVIKPLPYPDADRVVAVMEASPAARERISLMAPVRVEDWQRMSRTFATISGAYAEANTDTSQADPERLDGRRVAPRYFDVFAASPVLGRTFTDDEERFGGPGAAVISDGFWARRFQRSDRALKEALTIGGRSYPIVGVMPAGFAATSIDVWLPAQFAPDLLGQRGARFLGGVGRLKAGVTVDQARDDLDRVQRDLAARYPKTDAGWSAEVTDLKSYRIGDQARSLWLVFGAVGLLWLIAMTNVAGLVLVETRRRARELAIRVAIGASRAHVIGVVVQEVLVLATIGSAIGLVGAAWLVALAKSSLTAVARIGELTLDARAAAFAVATGMLAAVLCGFVPALVATRRRQAPLVGSGTRVAGGSHRWQRGLVAAQVALSLLLSASAVLLLRSYYNLTHVDPGFSSEHVLTFHVGARWNEDRNRVGQMQEAILAEALRVPGTESAGLTNFLPATDATLRYQMKIAGIAGPDGTGNLQAGSRTVSPGYLRALKVPLIAGDWCPELKTDFNAPLYAMVNRQFVDRFAQGMDLVGHQMMGVDVPGAPITIRGVVGDIAEDGPQAPRVPYVYNCALGGAWPDPNYVVRTSDPAAFTTNLHAMIRRVDSSRAIFAVARLDDILGEAVEAPRLNASLVGAFASGAMMLAAVGLYGLFTLVVSESRREIGVRLALGAQPVQVVRLVFADAGRVMVVGLAVGLALSIAANRAIRGLLFDVGPLDPGAFAAAVVTLVAVASAAIAIPALRASRVAPTEAMHAD
jgi:predicted permease